MNNDLISREALKKSLNFVYDCAYIDSKSKEGIVSDIIDEIDNAPAVKTYCYFCGQTEHGQIEERPIHCKDCKHTVLSEDGKTLICCLTMKVGTVRPNFYCGNGEMKGGAE